MSNSIEKITSSVVAVCALIATFVIVWREVTPRSSRGVVSSAVPNWEALSGGRHILGDSAAPLRVVMFADFQCPACRHFVMNTWPPVARRFPQEVALVIRHWPLDYHPHARMAGLSAACAATQGRFEAMHQLLYEVNDSLGMLGWGELAIRAGVSDTVAYSGCLHSSAANQEIDDDIALAVGLGGNGTPTILLAGRRFSNPPDSKRLILEIERQLP